MIKRKHPGRRLAWLAMACLGWGAVSARAAAAFPATAPHETTAASQQLLGRVVDVRVHVELGRFDRDALPFFARTVAAGAAGGEAAP